MDDILSVKLDDVPEVSEKRRLDKNNRKVDPLNHYEVECSHLSVLVSTDEYKEAAAVYAQSDSTAKALLHVQNGRREVLETNAPFMYAQPYYYEEEEDAQPSAG
jgi:hypothetical protein